MSGPVTTGDVAADSEATATRPSCVEVTESRHEQVGRLPVRRALPRRERRTVGAWCFVDHMGPAPVSEQAGIDIGPHPHIGLHTVTWLLAGEVLHRDSLGSEQVIRPGQLNLMTAGHGVAHAEEGTGRYRGELHGVQLWVAQPSATRHRRPAFEHHAELPRVELGAATATVLVGDLAGAVSPGRRDSDLVGADLDLRRPGAVMPLRSSFEYALVVFSGAVTLDRRLIKPGHLAYLGIGRDECRLSTDDRARALLVGGIPFPEPILMWWNFVGRTQDEISAAARDWRADSGRFGAVASALPRIHVGPPPWEGLGA